MPRISVSDQMVDATALKSEPYEEVEVSIQPDSEGYSLWVNIDGKCRLRATRISKSSLKLDIDPAAYYRLGESKYGR